MLSSPLSTFIIFPSSGLRREFLSIRSRSASRLIGIVASSLIYNKDNHTIEDKRSAKATLLACLKRFS